MKEYIVPVGDKGNMNMIENELHLQQLVRCMDCRWWHPDYKQQKGYCGQANGMTEKQPTWFCADGERREDHERKTSGESRSEEE